VPNWILLRKISLRDPHHTQFDGKASCAWTHARRSPSHYVIWVTWVSRGIVHTCQDIIKIVQQRIVNTISSSLSNHPLAYHILSHVLSFHIISSWNFDSWPVKSTIWLPNIFWFIGENRGETLGARNLEISPSAMWDYEFWMSACFYVFNDLVESEFGKNSSRLYGKKHVIKKTHWSHITYLNYVT